eukprot:2820302-Alexandrium_andersonii.AAC.1
MPASSLAGAERDGPLRHRPALRRMAHARGPLRSRATGWRGTRQSRCPRTPGSPPSSCPGMRRATLGRRR